MRSTQRPGGYKDHLFRELSEIVEPKGANSISYIPHKGNGVAVDYMAKSGFMGCKIIRREYSPTKLFQNIVTVVVTSKRGHHLH